MGFPRLFYFEWNVSGRFSIWFLGLQENFLQLWSVQASAHMLHISSNKNMNERKSVSRVFLHYVWLKEPLVVSGKRWQTLESSATKMASASQV